MVPPMGIQGEFRIERYNEMGQKNYDSGWVRNTITDFGMLSMTDSNTWALYFSIGTGSTPPDVGVPQMAAWLASESSAQSTDYPTFTDPPLYEKWTTIKKRFEPGDGIGTIREVGVGGNSSGGELFARQLVTPEVTKSATEAVDISWRLSKYPPLTAVTGQVDISGVTYDTSTSPYNIQEMNDFSGTFAQLLRRSTSWQCSDADAVGITDTSLTGNTLFTTTGDFTYNGSSGYSAGTGIGYRDIGVYWGLNGGNLAAGIRTNGFQHTSSNSKFQVQYNNASDGTRIPKDATKELYLNARISWVRTP